MQTRIQWSVGAWLCLLSCGSVTAQEPGQPNPIASPNATVPRSVTVDKIATPGAMMGRGADQTIATLIAIGNQEEVAMARLAETKIQNSDVRNFAETVIRDHTQFLTKLAQFGGYAGYSGQEPSAFRTGPNAGQLSPITKSIEQHNVQSVTPAAGQIQLQSGAQVTNIAPLDFVSLKRQIAQACIASAEKDLESKKPSEVEMEYVGSQIVAHKKMIDTLKVLRQYASTELQPVFDQGIQTTEAHLQSAQKLIKILAQSRPNQPSPDVSR